MNTFDEKLKIAKEKIYSESKKCKLYPTVGELIEMLKEFPEEMPVVIDTEEELVSVEDYKVLLETQKK